MQAHYLLLWRDDLEEITLLMKKSDKIYAAMYDIRRQLPIYPSTFSKCRNGCDKLGRGGSPCIDCATKALADLVGTEPAEAYRDAYVGLVDMERELMGLD